MRFPRLLGLAVLALLAPLSLSAAKIQFSSNPDGATIEILNVGATKMSGRTFDRTTPATIDLRRQSVPYQLRFSKPGFEPVVITVVHNQRQRELNVVLPPLETVQTVTFFSEPEGASVFVEGQELGASPIRANIRFTRPNSRSAWVPLEVRYSATDYQSVTGNIDESDWGGEFKMTLPQLRKVREIGLSTSPAGADVMIDGQLVGQTPLAHPVEFSRPNSNTPWTQPKVAVRLTDYEIENLGLNHDGNINFSFELQRIFHRKSRTLTITDDFGSPIPGAPVIVNGETVGKTDAAGKWELTLDFARNDSRANWNEFTLGSEVFEEYLPNQAVSDYTTDQDVTIQLDPVTELEIPTYFPITEMTSRGPRRIISTERRIGTFDDRDLNSPATDLRAVTNFERDQRSLSSVNSFTITPDGQQLIYALTMEGESGQRFSNLYRKSAVLATSSVTQLTRGSRYWDTHPRAGVEEGSSLVVFQSNRGVAESWDISSFRLQDNRVVGGIVQLTRDSRFNYDPSFSSEQQPVYFASMDEYPQAEPRISSVRIDGAAFTNLQESGDSLNLTTQDEIYFTRADPDTGKQQIYRITTDGFSFAQVINDMEFAQNNCFDPAISPDGSKMLFTSDYHQDEQGRHNNNIYLYDLKSGLTPLQLTDNGSDDVRPMWSPTEPDVIYFLSNRRAIYNVWRMTIRVAQ